MALPVDGYVRISKVGGREGEGFISPDVQERAIREWGARNTVEVLIQPHELNVSGGTMDRPIFNRVMERVRSGQSGGIVVYKTDRFARSLLGALSTLTELGEHDAVFASATEPELDYSTPHGRAFLQQMFVFAEYLRSTLKESWATSQRHAIERGVHIAPNGFLGYDRVDGRLVPNADAPTVAEAFRRRGRGEGWTAIADWLNEAAPREDGREWNGQAVQRLCAKRVYRGEASRYVGQDRDGRGAIVNKEAHPALVTEPEWQAAQMDPRLGQPRGSDPLPLLSGLIRCAGCRFGMSLGRGPKGERMYRCRARHASGRCPSPATVLANSVEEHVEGLVLGELERLVTQTVETSQDREQAAQALQRARTDLDGFRGDTAARRKLGPEAWHEWLDSYLDAVREAEAALERLAGQSAAIGEGLTADHYLDLDLADRREVLGGFMDTVFVRRSRGRGRNTDAIDSRVRVLWRGQAPADLPRPRIASEIVSFDFSEGEVEAGVLAP